MRLAKSEKVVLAVVIVLLLASLAAAISRAIHNIQSQSVPSKLKSHRDYTNAIITGGLDAL